MNWEQGFSTPQTMTPHELGDSLARLVWESFSDFIAEGDAEVPLTALGVPTEEGLPDNRSTEEALIFLLWAHTRGMQQAFVGRASDDLIHSGLDALHRAVFEDMGEHGTPESQLPIFEQRVSARYAEYHAAAADSDSALGQAVSRNLTGGAALSEAKIHAIVDRAVAVAGPLKDFLEEVELVG